MRSALFTAIFSYLLAAGCFAQDIGQLKAYADGQYATGNLSTALKEYQRVLLFDEQDRYRQVYGKIAEIFYLQDDFENALIYFDFARKAVENDSLSLEYSFKKVLCHYRMERYMLGLSELYDLPDQLPPYFSSKKELYLAICHFGLDEDQESLRYFAGLVDSAGFARIETSFRQLEMTRKKFDPDRLELMSIILPGLGQTVAGDVKSGLNSMLLLGGIITYAYFTMISYSILDGTLVLTSWFYRYYTGGHKKAHQLGEDKIREEKSNIYHQILVTVEDHPVRQTELQQ